MSTLRFLTAGESHGPKLSGIIEGLPAGFPIDPALINHDLQRRQQGFGRGGRMGIEKDVVSITAGVVNGLTTGAPIAIEITNLDYKSWATKMIEPMNAPRPGHADYAGAIKYDHSDLRISLERASARETAMRTAIGSLCKQILRPFGMHILGYVTQIGRIRSNVAPFTPEEFLKIYQTSLQNEFAMGEPQLLETVEEEIHAAMKGKDTLGGVFETVALGLPPGLGSYVHYDRKLDGIIAQAMMSIHAMKAVEIGDGIKNAGLLGTEVHDEFSLVGKNITRPTNRAGGLEGGVTNGMPLLVRTFMKPISTTLTPRQSIDLALKTKSPTVYERSDFCAVPRAVVVGEAMLSFVILQAFLEKVGGDSKKAMEQNFAHLHLGQVDDFALNNAPWQFKYDGV